MFQTIIKYTKALFLLSGLLGYAHSALAQQPDWSVDPSRYTNSMVVIGALNFDRSESLDPDDKIAAFIDGECRGLVQPMLVKEVNRYLAYLIIYSNESSGTISFKMWDASENRVLNGYKNLSFKVDELIGNVERPFVWSNVNLNTATEILAFSLPEQIQPGVKEGNELWLEVKPGIDLKALKPQFTLSEGAVALVNRSKQSSGTSVLDFTEAVVYTIRSEDEQVFEDYTVYVYQKSLVLPVTNLLTPNGDNYNDVWEVENIHLYKGFSLNVYDRNGSLVFTSKNYQNEWKGQNYKGEILPNGTYYYYFRGASMEYKGSVQLYK